MIKTLIRTLSGQNGELYSIGESRRIKLASCVPIIEIYEHSQTVNLLGTQNYKVKSHHSSIVICADREMPRDIDIGFLKTVTRFEFVGDFQRQDGVFERIRFDNLTPIELDLDGDWTFDAVGQNDITQKLIAL